MRLSLRASLAWVLFGLSFTLSPAAAALPSTEEVIAAHVRALGGRAALDAVHALIIRGRYSEGNFSTDAVQAKMRPYYKLVGDPGKPPGDFVEGYDGSSWEYYAKLNLVLRTVGAAAAASRHGLPILGPLVDYKAQGFTVTVADIENVAGHRAYRLRVHMPDGYEEDQFLDTKTYLPIASRKVAKIHAFGEMVATETRYSDFRKVKGVLFPFLAQKVEIASGKVLNTFKTTSIKINPTLDPSVFSPPQVKRTPLQALLQKLFAERTDKEATLWSYREFRRAHPDVDMDFAIEVIGYQILKMGDTETAVALLEENARAYPKSTGAQFGLGRAYNTAGETAKAKAAFRAALVLDPKNKRAAKALKTLEEPSKP